MAENETGRSKESHSLARSPMLLYYNGGYTTATPTPVYTQLRKVFYFRQQKTPST